jgi:hypothetical protein
MSCFPVEFRPLLTLDRGYAWVAFKIKRGQLLRYSVLYHSQKKEPLDLIIYFGDGYKEPWYLLVPSGISLTAEEIVELYAKRMSIEQGFEIGRPIWVFAD